MTPAARMAAAGDLLAAIEQACFATPASRRPADAVASAFFRARRYIGAADRRAVAALAWGVIRQRLRLEWHLMQLASAITPRALLLAYLVMVEHNSPAALEKHFDGSRYAPAPLDAAERRLVAALARRRLHHPAMPRHIALNLPAWVMPSLAARFGDRLAVEAAALEAEAPLDLRVNLLKIDRAAAAVLLAAEGIATTPTPFSPWGLRVAPRRDITTTRAFREGWVEIQDEGSQLIALLTDARPGMRVVDYCAGAGGKTLALAASMANRGRIVACDSSAPRLAAAIRRLRRAGVDNVERHWLRPGDRWVKRRSQSFDRVLVDVPCSGTGTWRRHPDARLRTTPTDVAELVARQEHILREAATLVRPGGRLIYATCSLLGEENEEQMARFLATHPAFRPLPLAELWAGLCPGTAPPGEGLWTVLSPAAHGTDGFFCAVLEYKS